MKNHLTGIDFLRGLAALGIVGCHLSLANPTAGAKWLGMFTDLNVGVFAMLAGLFYAGSCAKFDSWSDYLKQRGSRLLVPYVLWSIFYVTIDIVFDTLAGKTLTFQPNSGRYWASVVFQGGGAAHLWFLIVLFYVQAIGFFPMKRMGASALSTSLCAVLGFGCITACSFLDGWFSNYPLRLTGFFLVGVTISRSLDVILKLPVFAVGGGCFARFSLAYNGMETWIHWHMRSQRAIGSFCACMESSVGKVATIGCLAWQDVIWRVSCSCLLCHRFARSDSAFGASAQCRSLLCRSIGSLATVDPRGFVYFAFGEADFNS